MRRKFVLTLVVTLAFAAQSSAARREAEWQGKITTEVLQKMMAGSSAISVIVLLQDQTETNPALSKMSIAENLDAFALEAEVRVQEVVDTVPPADLLIQHRYRSFSGFSGEATPEGIERIAQHPLVRLVIPNSKVYPARLQGNGLMGTSQITSKGFRGAGVTVAVIDDGVAWDHPELGGGTTFPNSVVLGGYDFVDKVDDPYPGKDSTGAFDSHGTSVAGIIAGRGDGAGGFGVAPEAKLVGLRVLGPDGGNQANLIAAIDWSVTNRTRVSPAISILNISIQGPVDYPTPCDSVPEEAGSKAAVDRAVGAGLAVVVATGNHGKVGHTSPGCLSKVISVSSVYDANVGEKRGFFLEKNPDGTDRKCDDLSTAADQVPCYANISSFTTLLGPAHDARSPKAGGGYDETFGGTSAAAPYAAGAIALLKSALPNRSFTDIVNALRSTGKPVADSGVTVPRINLDAAYVSLGGPPPPSGACAVNSTTLCLNNGRFKVQAGYTLPDGRNGQGQAVAITGDTGYFWFFNASNVEMVLKLIDACPSRYWVFAGGLTNIQVDMTVTDTKTGALRQYRNPQGTAFQPVQDTNAFASCP